MHIDTIIRVRAESAEEAIERVNRLMSGDGDYCLPPPFDWFDEEATAVSNAVRDDESFRALREEERNGAREAFRRYQEALESHPEDESWLGYQLQTVAECLRDDQFWSVHRLAYDLARQEQLSDECPGGTIYYIRTDRHC